MTEYISKQELLDKIKDFPADKGTFALMNWVYQTVKKAPAADVAPAVHAHKSPYQIMTWEELNRPNPGAGSILEVKCSKCKLRIDYTDRYCRHCGAKMDENQEEAQ